MYEKLAWSNFYKTGDIQSFMEYKSICKLNDEFKIMDENVGGFASELDQSKWDNNKRGTV